LLGTGTPPTGVWDCVTPSHHMRYPLCLMVSVGMGGRPPGNSGGFLLLGFFFLGPWLIFFGREGAFGCDGWSIRVADTLFPFFCASGLVFTFPFPSCLVKGWMGARRPTPFFVMLRRQRVFYPTHLFCFFFVLKLGDFPLFSIGTWRRDFELSPLLSFCAAFVFPSEFPHGRWKSFPFDCFSAWA